MKRFKKYQRVKFKDKDFLSNGYIKKVVGGGADFIAYIVKLDEKAPNEYAYETDEVMAFADDIEEE